MAKPIEISKKIRKRVEEVLEQQMRVRTEEARLKVLEEKLECELEIPVVLEIKYNPKANKIELKKVYSAYDLSREERMEKLVKNTEELKKYLVTQILKIRKEMNEDKRN